MKRRFLPFGLITAFAGFFLLFCSVLLMAGQPGNPELTKHDLSRWASVRSNQLTGTVNPADVMKARREAEMLRMKSADGAMGLNWLSAGPDNYSGIIRSVIYDNTDQTGNTIIAGAASGGIWKSINKGLTWTQMAVENNNVPKVSWMVQASNGTLYAATGVTTCHKIQFTGTGIYTSKNGSAFSAIPSTQSNTDFAGISKMVIDATGRMWVATVGGLYYSDNYADFTKAKPGYTMDVCVGSDNTVIAAFDDGAYMAPAGNLSSWVTLTTGLANTLPNAGVSWMVFAISPSDVNVMYASFAGTDGKLLNIYNSTDKGSTWSVIFPKNPTFEPFGGAGCYANTLAVSPTDPYQLYLGGGDMWHGRRVQPTGYYNWEVVSNGAYSPWYPTSAPALHHSYMFCPTNHQEMLVATDGGVSVCSIKDTITFKTINKLLSTSQFNSVAFSAQRGYVMGGGDRIGTLAMGYFYPKSINSPSDGFPVFNPEGFFFGGDGNRCEWSNIDSRIAIFTDYGFVPTTRRRDMTDLTYDNDFNYGVYPVDSTNVPMTMWESFKFAQTRDSVKVTARIQTIPADTTIMVESANNKFRFPYTTTAPIVKGSSITIADPIANRYFFYGKKSTTYGIWMTKDLLKFNVHPQHFLVYADTAKKADYINTITVSADLNTLWAGTKLGRLIRVTGLIQAHDSATAIITNPGCVLVDSVFSFPAMLNRVITSISINPANTSQVMVTLGNYGNQDYVFFTQNGNAAKPTFTSVQSNLPKAPVYSGLIELHGNNAIVGTDFGVFTTTNINNGTPQWASDIQNLGDVPVTDIRQQVMHDFHIQNYGVIYLASYGRGIWLDTTYYAPVGIEPVSGRTVNYGSLTLTPNPVKDILTIGYTNEISGNLTATVYDLTGRIVLVNDFGHQPKGDFTGKIETGSLPQGTYLVKVGNSTGKIVKL